MSDNWLRYLPCDPFYRPSADEASRTVDAVRKVLPAAEQIGVSTSALPCFVDPGENWDGVACPHCQAEIEEWWGDEMSRLADDNGEFITLQAATPCCGRATSLNDLLFRWPAAYGCFVVDVKNPDHAGLDSIAMSALSEAAGFSVREIAQHL